MRDEVDGQMPGWKAMTTAALGYAALVAVATYPLVFSIRSAIASRVDPVTHLTIMRWYRACWLGGTSPFHHPGIQYPFGAPVGTFPPMHLQTLIYLGLSAIFDDDALIYNILWFGGFLLTGVGTFALACRVVEDRACAWFAGAMVMLGGPMMLHAHGHLELMYVGWFSLFLAAWTRFVDRPGWRAMGWASGFYVLMTCSTAYFAVLAVIPAAWYVGVGALGSGRIGGWLRDRAGWLLGFSAVVLPFVIAAFAGPLWGMARGAAMDRPFREFEDLGAPWYSYVMPTTLHPIGRWIGVDAYDALGHPAVECASYLGVVTLALLACAAIGRVGRRFWWSTLAILIVLSFGASLRVSGYRVELPGGWLWRHTFVFRALRAPGRFNLLASVIAAVLAASSLERLLAHWPGKKARWAAVGALTALALCDLATIPFPAEAIPPVPPCYAALLRNDPAATFLDAPLRPSGIAHPLSAASGYWQGTHHGRTTGGYSSHANISFDNQIVHNTPFSVDAMAEPDYLLNPADSNFGIVHGVDFLDYAWLYLTAHDLRHVVLHQSPWLAPEAPAGRGRLKTLLHHALIFEDADTAVFDRDRLSPPSRSVLALADGWRGGWHRRPVLVASKRATLAAYNPDPASELTFTLSARTFRQARSVRLRVGETTLATWDVRPDALRTYQSPPFHLPAGRLELKIEADGEDRPRHRHEEPMMGDDRPYSLTVGEVRLRCQSDGVGW